MVTWTKGLLGLVLVWVATDAYAAHSLTGDQLQQHIAMLLVLDQDADRTRLGAKTIGQLYADRTELMDGVAEMLSRSHGLRQVGDTVDVLAVYAAVLGKSKSPRYRDVLLTARRAKNEDKVSREIDAALASIGKVAVEQYRAGSLDTAAATARIRQSLSDNRESDRSAFTKTLVGADMRHVMDSIGAPDEVSAVTQIGSIGRRAMIVAHYYGRGLVAFRLERDADTQWSVYEVANEKVPVNQYRGNQLWFAQAIACMRGIQYRNLIRFYSKQWQDDPEMIAILTQRLAVMDDLDDYEQDATKYIPQVLARTSVPNEMSMWEQVKVRAKTRLVRKVAATRIAQLRKMRTH